MKTETRDKFQVLTPDEGFALYDGRVVSRTVFRPLGARGEWREITEAEAEAIEAEARAAVEAAAEAGEGRTDGE